MKEEIQEIVKEYLKENMDISVTVEKYYGDYGSNEGVKVCVCLSIEGEEIYSSYDYTSL
jgi:hypothetical protein